MNEQPREKTEREEDTPGASKEKASDDRLRMEDKVAAEDKARERGNRQRREKKSRRRQRIRQGKLLLLLALFLAIGYYVANVLVVVADARLAYGAEDMMGYVSAIIVMGLIALLATICAIGTYRGHDVARYLYTILNGLGGLAGMIWLVIAYAQERTTVWHLLDVAGVAIAFLVVWTIFLSENVEAFFHEQHLRKR